MAYNCVDCNKPTKVQTSIRCRSCARAHQWSLGKYDHRRTQKQNYCIDCGVKISRTAKRCSPCAGRATWRKPGFREQKATSQKAAWRRGEKLGTVSYRQELSDAAFAQWGNAESRKKILEAREGMWTPELRQQVSGVMKQIAADEEWRVANSERMSIIWTDESYQKKVSVGLSNAWKRGAFDGVYKSPSGLEKEVAEAFDACGILYVSQYRLEDDSRPFDFFVPAAVMLVEVDGEYWHGLPSRAERDAQKNKLAKERGFELLRIKETDIHEQGAEVIVKERILPVCTCICGGDYAPSSR